MLVVHKTFKFIALFTYCKFAWEVDSKRSEVEEHLPTLRKLSLLNFLAFKFKLGLSISSSEVKEACSLIKGDGAKLNEEIKISAMDKSLF